MASIDKVKVGDTTYDISPSATGTLNGYTSNDNGTPPAEWGAVSTISAGDTNSSIFGKLTSMVRNVRWLYSKLGTEDFSVTGQSTVSGALSGLNSELGNKSNASHTHSTGTLPTSSNQVNSTSYIPTSALLYSMKERVDGIQSLVAIAKRELDDPNKRYESKSLGTFAAYDVDMMLTEYTHENNYGDLALGNYFGIQDGTYNVEWEIAGFDMECGQIADDDTIYDNGYGICLIPKTYVTKDGWSKSGSGAGGTYMSSYIHTIVLPGIITTLKNVLGDHIVNRNVLLSSSKYQGFSDAYTWTTAEATLMSAPQVGGSSAMYRTRYDDGEAIYKLPLFNHESKKSDSAYWLRGLNNSNAYYVSSLAGNIDNNSATNSYGVRPLIYIR